MASNLLMNSEEDLITIIVYYKIKKGRHGGKQIVIIEEKEAQNALESGDTDIETLETRWKPQTWQTNNSLIKNSMTYNKIAGSEQIDWAAYNQNIFRYCLEAWNVTDSTGSAIPPTPENVGKLPSNVAQTLIRKYEDSLSLDDEEKKE